VNDSKSGQIAMSFWEALWTSFETTLSSNSATDSTSFSGRKRKVRRTVGYDSAANGTFAENLYSLPFTVATLWLIHLYLKRSLKIIRRHQSFKSKVLAFLLCLEGPVCLVILHYFRKVEVVLEDVLRNPWAAPGYDEWFADRSHHTDWFFDGQKQQNYCGFDCIQAFTALAPAFNVILLTALIGFLAFCNFARVKVSLVQGCGLQYGKGYLKELDETVCTANRRYVDQKCPSHIVHQADRSFNLVGKLPEAPVCVCDDKPTNYVLFKGNDTHQIYG
jgi:hypothetical protein